MRVARPARGVIALGPNFVCNFFKFLTLSFMIRNSFSVTVPKNTFKAFIIIGITDLLGLLSNNRSSFKYSSMISQSPSILFISCRGDATSLSSFPYHYLYTLSLPFFPVTAVSAYSGPIFANNNLYCLRSIVNVICHFNREIVTSCIFFFLDIVHWPCLRTSTIVAKISKCNSPRLAILQES